MVAGDLVLPPLTAGRAPGFKAEVTQSISVRSARLGGLQTRPSCSPSTALPSGASDQRGAKARARPAEPSRPFPFLLLGRMEEHQALFPDMFRYVPASKLPNSNFRYLSPPPVRRRMSTKPKSSFPSSSCSLEFPLVTPCHLQCPPPLRQALAEATLSHDKARDGNQRPGIGNFF